MVRVACVLVLLRMTAVAYAADTPLHRSSWGLQDGAPAEVEALAQTADGALWLGSAFGLVRFDGVDFDSSIQAELPQKDVAALLAEADGALWIGYRRGGLSRLQDGTLTHYGFEHGMPESGVLSIARDASGSLWLATPTGLMRQSGERWVRVAEAAGYAGQRPVRLFVDRQGALWVSDADGLYRRDAAGGFERIEAGTGVAAHLAQTPDGTVWASDPLRGLRRPGLDVTSPRVLRSGVLLADRRGRLWVSNLPGLTRIDDASSATASPVQSARESTILALLEDREGVLWLGTRRGLERLRPAKFATVALPPVLEAQAAADREAMSCPQCPTPHASLFLALAPADGSAIWVGSRQHLMQVRAETETHRALASRISCAYRDPAGTLWLGGEAALWRLAGDRIESLELPEAVDDPQDQVQAMTVDARGALWVSIARKGVYRRDAGGWTLSGGIEELPVRPAIAMLTDSRGRIWFSYKDSRIAVLDGGSLRIFGATSGLALGPVLALAERGGRVWAAGERGLVRFDGMRFRPVIGSGGDIFADTSGVVETAAGDLWLSTAAGAVRIAAEEVDRVTQDPQHHVRHERFDHLDGLDGSAEQFRPLPTLVEADDGQLWFATTTALARIDPARIVRNPLPPPVHIDAISAQGTVFGPQPGLELPKGTKQLQIDYSALSLAMPERVRFRYRLQGADADWQEAGTRRTAFYTNLRRGPYRFEVIASNEDGVWSEQGAGLDFSIAPTVIQTPWFRLLCAVLVFCALWMLYLIRLRQMSERIRVRFEARQAERERIARELHDTLLQGFQGVILRLQAVMLQLDDARARRAMEQALERADAVLVEGRDRVRLVREGEQSDELGRAVAGVGEELVRDGGTRFRIIELGARCRVCPLVRAELFAICREALFNTVLHANAQSVEVEIRYGTESLRVVVRDDGRGIDAGVLVSGGRDGHFGLPGMRERAQRLGSSLNIRSRPGVGTEITVRVPASIAYAEANKMPLLRRLRRLLLAEDVVERAGPPP
ncbi:MAG: two-component regulator propeller domain-containing protein [Sinimarinibacterium flocculans]|uniref:sensor histidine kinase n=1 Tax=Sinimarinibacterium flocculans TaxID=985250 RepID=UPI003C6569B4